ncbi:hypothetical protein [Antarcticibacterium sp. 1MA-6-2]|uniref:hypothetical protein n=1 Tax=Antarcticibacterium sp. 1MA-6-2 TaxID=2908210 RepID=UPI002882F1B6|nr:hypothetical protein [Antarcticibacterium sp. 1MA-6-2]
MKTITIYLSIFIMSLGMQLVQAQETEVPQEIIKLQEKREQVIAEEKAALKKEVESINTRLEAREISTDEATRLKEEAAKKHALNIENRLAIIENEIEWLSINEDGNFKSREESTHFSWGKKKDRYRHSGNRTSSQLVIAAGLNNVIQEGVSLDDSDFQLGGSRFFELGVAWRTRVFNNSNWLRLRYGISFQFNGLKPTDNRYFVENEDLTVLEEYPLELDKSKFRMDNLVFPLHFEFGPSYSEKTDWGRWFSSEDKFRIGLGGYA